MSISVRQEPLNKSISFKVTKTDYLIIEKKAEQYFKEAYGENEPVSIPEFIRLCIAEKIEKME